MMTLCLLLAQSLLQDGSSPYDPPKQPELKKHDHVQIEFVDRSKAQPPAEQKPRWDKELRQWVRFDGKDAAPASVVLTAEVIDIRPNGTLVLQAIKRRTLNGAEETLRLTGEASPRNLHANKVSSEHVLNLSVSVDGPTGRAGTNPDTTCRDARLTAEFPT